MSEVVNGTMYRALINGEEIKQERSVSFEPDEIKITILTNEVVYQKWLKRKGEEVNFKLTNTNIDLQLVIQNVFLIIRLENAVEVVLKLWSAERIKEHNSFMAT